MLPVNRLSCACTKPLSVRKSLRDSDRKQHEIQEIVWPSCVRAGIDVKLKFQPESSPHGGMNDFFVVTWA
jgi:hypothetical protein